MTHQEALREERWLKRQSHGYKQQLGEQGDREKC